MLNSSCIRTRGMEASNFRHKTCFILSWKKKKKIVPDLRFKAREKEMNSTKRVSQSVIVDFIHALPTATDDIVVQALCRKERKKNPFEVETLFQLGRPQLLFHNNNKNHKGPAMMRLNKEMRLRRWVPQKLISLWDRPPRSICKKTRQLPSGID